MHPKDAWPAMAGSFLGQGCRKNIMHAAVRAEQSGISRNSEIPESLNSVSLNFSNESCRSCVRRPIRELRHANGHRNLCVHIG